MARPSKTELKTTDYIDITLSARSQRGQQRGLEHRVAREPVLFDFCLCFIFLLPSDHITATAIRSPSRPSSHRPDRCRHGDRAPCDLPAFGSRGGTLGRASPPPAAERGLPSDASLIPFPDERNLRGDLPESFLSRAGLEPFDGAARSPAAPEIPACGGGKGDGRSFDLLSVLGIAARSHEADPRGLVGAGGSGKSLALSAVAACPCPV